MTNLADEDAQRTIHSTVLNPHAGDKLLRKKQQQQHSILKYRVKCGGEVPISSMTLQSRPQGWKRMGQKLLVLFQMYCFILSAFIVSVELFLPFKLSILTLFKFFNITEGRFGFSIGKTAQSYPTGEQEKGACVPRHSAPVCQKCGQQNQH